VKECGAKRFGLKPGTEDKKETHTVTVSHTCFFRAREHFSSEDALCVKESEGKITIRNFRTCSRVEI
jgi:hypothetical protein